MEKLTLKRFLDWRLVGIILFYAIIHEFQGLVSTWYYNTKPIEIDPETFILISINFANLLVITCSTFYLIRWLNRFLAWSRQNLFLRTIIEIVLFFVVSTFWLILFNEAYSYVKIGFFFGLKEIILFSSTGSIINFLVIPLVELSILLHSKKLADENTEQLLVSNEQFKYEILKNQINPHFLFNSLSVLNSLILIDQNKARVFTQNFSNVLRHVLDYKHTDSITLSEEKEFLEQYIYLLKTRFGDALDVQIHLPSHLEQRKILPMVLQLLTENVIKHNEVSEVRPMKVKIEAHENGVSICNQVQLKTSVSSWGIGLSNIQSRYQRLEKDIQIEHSSSHFKVVIPYITTP